MRRFAASFVIFVAFLVALPGYGAESSRGVKAALIEEYIEVTQAEKNLEETLRLSFDGSEDQMRDALGVTELDLAEMDAETKLEYQRSLAEQKEYMDRILERLLARLDLEALAREAIAPVLDRYFSEDDLRAMIAYYKTPTGQKQVENKARIALETELATSKVVMPLMSEIMEELQKERDEDEHRKHPWKRALSDMRTIATCVEAYATDENEYPQAVTISALASAVEPTYVRELPEKDPWGNDYVYMVSSDGQHYRIICGGADKSIDGTSRVIAELGPGIGDTENESLDDDIVYQDAMFVTWPPGGRPVYPE